MAADNIKDRVSQAMKDAMRAKDSQRLGTIRLIQAAFKQKEVDERVTINDDMALTILDKMLKQRRESIEQYKLGNREDLVAKEELEVSVIQEFLPPELGQAEIAKLITQAIKASGAQTMRDMGSVMAVLKPKLQGRADMSKVSALVRDQLEKK